MTLMVLRLRRPAFPVKKCDALNTIAAIAVRRAWLLMTDIFVTSATLMTVGLDHAITTARTPAAAGAFRAGCAIVCAGSMVVRVVSVTVG